MKHLDYDHEIKKINSTKKLRELYSDYILLIRATLDKFNNEKNPKYYKIVYQNLLQRLYYGIKSIDTLFNKFNRDKNFKYPIAIQMRTCLLDSITATYLALFIEKKSERKFRGQVARLNKPVAKEINNEIQEIIRVEKLKPNEYKKHFELAASHFPDNFISGTIPKFNTTIKEIKPNEMVKGLSDTPLDWFGKSYKFYKHYSKYEHFGSISKTLLNFNAEYEFDKLTIATYYVFQATYMIMQCMEVGKQKIEKMKTLRDRINDVEPTFKNKKQ